MSINEFIFHRKCDSVWKECLFLWIFVFFEEIIFKLFTRNYRFTHRKGAVSWHPNDGVQHFCRWLKIRAESHGINIKGFDYPFVAHIAHSLFKMPSIIVTISNQFTFLEFTFLKWNSFTGMRLKRLIIIEIWNWIKLLFGYVYSVIVYGWCWNQIDILFKLIRSFKTNGRFTLNKSWSWIDQKRRIFFLIWKNLK